MPVARDHEVVKRDELRAAATRAGVLASSYVLEPEWRHRRNDDMYVLAIEDGGWVVYYSERGRRNALAWFETESEACDELLLRLTQDPTTRRY